MPDVVCSLTVPDPQTIPPGGSAYVVVRFPFGVAESYDPFDMHPPVQPDGSTVSFADPRSGLIWPAHHAWGRLDAMLHWDDGDYTEVRDRFVRDPLGMFGPPDSTCTQDHPATGGGQYLAKSWALFVHPGVPLGLAVRHNCSRPLRLTFAEFKLSYRLDDPGPVTP
ncbi:hypothetical protein [Sphaerisporangium sp. TRM90804]|uniref:hypothetical protein n=1 Tax=Sphaerisporangium sp. TRM90804 TaxID=3031113 RepID=UPI00244B33F7|nr:hypothetical protein [Sphaerisporangium sp. TRM90804]MDH2425791.1 hypothetical protein [Sphaerisporangium sp. TRM90804]